MSSLSLETGATLSALDPVDVQMARIQLYRHFIETFTLFSTDHRHEIFIISIRLHGERRYSIWTVRVKQSYKCNKSQAQELKIEFA